MAITLNRVSKCVAHTGLSRSKFYQDVAEGLLPPLVRISTRASGLPDYELDAVQAAKIAGKSTDEIRALVRKLIAARKGV